MFSINRVYIVDNQLTRFLVSSLLGVIIIRRDRLFHEPKIEVQNEFW